MLCYLDTQHICLSRAYCLRVKIATWRISTSDLGITPLFRLQPSPADDVREPFWVPGVTLTLCVRNGKIPAEDICLFFGFFPPHRKITIYGFQMTTGQKASQNQKEDMK